ncbi:MAG: PQQ-binding-like beta-propeller repeat protein [Bacteroidota bacterium]
MFKNYRFSILFVFSLVFIFSACKEDTTVPKSSTKSITKFTFSQLSPIVQATIDESTKRITAVVPPTADVSKLIPSISVSAKAKVLPDSGKVQDFTNEVTYSVTAEDGSKQDYKVMVNRTKFSGNDILSFIFADFSPAITAKIDPVTKTISATVPATADLTKLKPTITLSDRATINPASTTVVDFSKTVNFTVTAEDARMQVYAVTVVKEIPESLNDNTAVFISNQSGEALAIDAVKGTLKWKDKVDLRADIKSPIITNGLAYFSGYNKIYGFDMNTGKSVWNYTDFFGGYIGNTPLVIKNTMFIPYGESVVCINMDTKKQIWTYTTTESIYSSICEENGVIFFTSGYLGGKGILHAVDGTTGKKLWSYNLDAPTGPDNTSPAVVNNVVYVCAGRFLEALDAKTGTPKWSSKLQYGGLYLGASPTVLDGIVYVADRFVYAFDANTGKQKWQFGDNYSTYDSSPFVKNGFLYIGNSSNEMVSINVETGKQNWLFKAGNSISSSPCYSNGVIFFGSSDSNLYSVDANTGKLQWSYKTGAAISSSPTVIDKNGKVYYSSQSGFQN